MQKLEENRFDHAHPMTHPLLILGILSRSVFSVRSVLVPFHLSYRLISPLIKPRFYAYLIGFTLLLFADSGGEALQEPGPSKRPFSFVDPYFETVGDRDSIPLGVITALAQDPSGILWVGTQNGLCRYDGYHFRRYTSTARTEKSLAENYVSCLWINPKGQVWIGYLSGGISLFEPEHEQFQHFTHQENRLESLSKGCVYRMTGDENGLWIATNSGLDYLSPGSVDFKHYQQEPYPGLTSNQIRSLLLDKRGGLWVGTMKGISYLARESDTFENVIHEENFAKTYSNFEVMTLLMAEDGKLWVGTSGIGLFYLDVATKKLQNIETSLASISTLDSTNIAALSQPNSDQIWVGKFGGGITILSAKTGDVLKQIVHDPSAPGCLNSNDIGTFLIDASGLLWVGHWGSGLQKYNPHNKTFQHLRYSLLKTKSLSNSNVISILERRDGKILVGSAGNGIDIIDRYQGLVGGYRPKPHQAGALGEGQITSMVEMPDGVLWVGTRTLGACRLSADGKSWRSFSVKEGLPHCQVNRLFLDSKKRLWAATSAGLARWAESQQRFVAYFEAEGNQGGAIAIDEDRQGRIWVGSQQGLKYLNPEQDEVGSIRFDSNRPESINSNEILSVYVDHANTLWVTTFKGLDRLAKWDGEHAEFDHVSKRLGLMGQYMGANLLEDHLGRIWSDAMVYDPVKDQIYQFSIADGIDIDGAWCGSFAKLKEGSFLFGGPLGLVIVDPNAFQPWSYQPPLVATALKIDGHPKATGMLKPNLVLSPNQHNFAIEFAALDYSAPGKNRYQYRMLGFDKDWIETEAENRNASYGNLWPGVYKLEVRGTNRKGQWSPHTLEIPIRVLPAFWETGWFALLLILLAVSLIYGGYLWRTKRLIATAKALQSMVDERTADILNLGLIGQELTLTLDLEQAFERVYQQVSARLDSRIFSIGLYEEAEGCIRFVYMIENGQRDDLKYKGEAQNQPAVCCVRERKALVFSNATELQAFLGTPDSNGNGTMMETQVYLPLLAKKKVIGCLMVQSPQPNAYNQDQLKFLSVLSSYAAIALENANIHSDLVASLKRLKESQQQMVVQEKMASIGTLTAGIAHELNNPLNFINNFAELTYDLAIDFQEDVKQAKGKQMEDSTAELFEKIAQSVKSNSMLILKHGRRANQIVKSMSEIVKKSGSKKTVQDFNGFVKEYVNVSYQYERVNDESFRLEIDFDLDPSVGEIWIRPQDMGRVINNLVNNSVDAIKEKAARHTRKKRAYTGKLEVRTRISKASVWLEIKDNGIGIPNAQIKEIFTPFFTTKPTGNGHVGLGLSVSYEIVVKEHGGELLIESKEGEWTCVKLKLSTEKRDESAKEGEKA